MPYGISSAPEIFHRVIKQIFDNIEGVDTYIDDILIYGTTIEEHDARLKLVLDKVKEYNIKLNRKKCVFRTNTLTYMGHKLSNFGISPDEKKIQAIINFKKPENKKDVQRFLGILTYLSKFIPNLSQLSSPLRSIIKKNVHFEWSEEQEKCFKNFKTILSKNPVLQYYSANKQVILSVDASKDGLGAVLLQDGAPVAYASRALTSVQKHYAQIEKELLAICFGCERFREYLYGRQFIVETDHKPLLPIIKKPLNDCPLRLQRLLLLLQYYEFTLNFKKGKELYIADALSRAYDNTVYSDDFDHELEGHADLLIMSINASDQQMQKINF